MGPGGDGMNPVFVMYLLGRRWRVGRGWIVAIALLAAPVAAVFYLARALNRARPAAGSWIEPTVARVRGGSKCCST